MKDRVFLGKLGGSYYHLKLTYLKEEIKVFVYTIEFISNFRKSGKRPLLYEVTKIMLIYIATCIGNGFIS